MSLKGYAIDWHGRCPYCGVTLTEFNPEKETGTERSKDHMIPQRVGGTVFRNLVWCCMNCNRDKHHLSLLEWRVIRLMRGLNPFFAWDIDVPGVLWRHIITSTFYSPDFMCRLLRSL